MLPCVDVVLDDENHDACAVLEVRICVSCMCVELGQITVYEERAMIESHVERRVRAIRWLDKVGMAFVVAFDGLQTGVYRGHVARLVYGPCIAHCS